MGSIGWEELLIIAVVILVLFGSRKIPEFMRGLGHGMREFNNAKDGVTRKELEETPEQNKTAATDVKQEETAAKE